MIKVRVIRGVQAGLPLASGFLALGTGVTACAAETAPEVTAADESDLTVTNAGEGVFELTWAWGTPTGFGFVARGSTDEYVRAQQKMTFAIPAHFLWSQLHPSQQTPADAARLKKLSVTAVVSYLKNGASYAGTSVTADAWEGDSASALRATTPAFVVDRRAHAIRFALELRDDADGTTKRLDESNFFTQAVIGGSLPDKTLLFDTSGATLRSRVLEGGRPVEDADLFLAYTDWRAATLVDASRLDREIGTERSFGRFGPSEIPVYGEIEHEVSFEIAADGNWQDEQRLVPNGQSRLLPANRLAYEGTISIPAGVQNVALRFHVKTFLKADYTRYPNIHTKKYADNARVLVAEKWDTKDGAEEQAYDFATETR